MLRCLNQLKILLVIAVYFISNDIKAQTTHLLPPNQPEQDACNAIQLCGNNFFTPYSYQDEGKVLDLDSTPCFPVPGGGEFNSVWFKINISKAGKLVFKIIPVDTANDYDFAVLNSTGTGCSNLKLANVVRCNFNNNVKGSNAGGIVGLSLTSITPIVYAGASHNSFCQAIDAIAGESYLIMVDNVAANENSGTGALSGFTLDFSGTTAIFDNSVKPALSSTNISCSGSSITLNLNTAIFCSSIATDGSDFSSNAPVAIISAESINCTDIDGYTNTVILHFSSAIPRGNYFVQAKEGTDGNTLISVCNNILELPSKEIPFTISATGIEATENKSICYEQFPYLWNGNIVTKAGNAVASYTTTSLGGCDSTTTLNLSVGNAPAQTNIKKSICPYETYTLPWDSTVTSAGTYTHHYKNKSGCDSVVEVVVVKDSACRQYLYIPTAFTPNTDNKNDIFKPISEGKLLQYSFIIYNRWGKRIFFSKDPSRGWDGTVDRLQQPAGTYVWICNYKLAGQSLRTEKGTVTLIR